MNQILFLFHHIHHEGKKHKVHHCGGKHRELDYKIKHCGCGMHNINKRIANGHDFDNNSQVLTEYSGQIFYHKLGLQVLLKMPFHQY